MIDVTAVLVFSYILRSLKHHVLEKMGQSGKSRCFIAGSHTIMDTHMGQWNTGLVVDQKLESVFQVMFLEFYVRYLDHLFHRTPVC
jgi:hypothetical protein